MASQGPFYPGTVTTVSVSTESANDWLNASNVGADDGTEAQITAATYDAGDISFRLRVSNFGFTIPFGATINGVVVEIDRRCFAGAASDFRVQLLTSSGAVTTGTNKASATAWPATSAVATYGSSSDLWGVALTPSYLNNDMQLALSVNADAANTDIGVDFIRMTVYYTEDTNITVTPSTRALTTSRFAPTVTASDHKLVTPATRALVTALFAPSVTLGLRVTPATLALLTSAFAPTVTVTDNQRVVPATLALVTARFAPTVTATDHKLVVPATLALVTSRFAPVVTASDHQLVVPSTAALLLSAFAPTVSATSGSDTTVTPGTLALVLSAFAPTVTASDHKLVTPATRALVTSRFAPTVTASDRQIVTPGTVALVLAPFAPTVSVIGSALVVPEPAILVLSGYAPTVSVAILTVAGDVLKLRPHVRLRYPWYRGLRRR